MLIASGWVTNAQNSTLTTCNGTANHEYVPFYGYYADESQHNQMIYPADSLTAMNGEAILQMVFYIDQTAENGSNTAADRMGTWTVSLGETTATTLSGLDNSTTLTQVYQGYFDCSTGTLTLEFEAPYSYNGGNLLVDIQHAAASWNRWYFLGVTATGASYCYNSQRDFLPKVQFTYGTAPTCIRPAGLSAVVNGDTATVTWVDTAASAWDIVWGRTGFNPDTVLVNTDISYTTTYEITGLEGGLWQAYVRANCGGETSFWLGPVNIGVGIYYMATTGIDTLRTCGTVIYDDGGANNSYSSNCQSTVILLPSQPNSVVKISGSSYTESSWDYLYIYDGIGTNGDVLWTDYNVSALQSFGPFMSDAITIVFQSDGSVTYSGFEINVSCEPVPTCARPDSLSIDSVGADFVTLSWIDPVGTNWSVAYGPSGFTIGDATTQWADFTTTTGTITNLVSGMKYDFYVMSVCGSNEGDTSWTRLTTTYTACDVISVLPYTENFDGLDADDYADYNPCWTRGANYSTNNPYVYNYSYMGVPSNFLYFYTSSYSYSDGKEWTVMPAVSDDIEMNSLEISFMAYPLYNYDNYCHNLIVGIIDSSAYVDSMTIDTIAILNPTAPTPYYISFAGYTGTGKNIIFFHWLDGNSSYGYLGLDDIDLHLLPQCDRPDSLSLVSADSTSLNLTWWASDNSTDFFVEWRTGSAAYQGYDASSNSFTITNLTPNTLYDVRVRTVCGSDTSIAASGQFRTSCINVVNFPYTEGFENNTYLCWSNYDFDGYSDDNWQRYDYSQHSGSYCFYSSYNGSTNGTNWLVSPAIEIPASMEAATLSWYISGGVYSGIAPHYAVKISTTSNIDTTTFTTVLEEDRDDYDDNTNTYIYYKRSVSLAQYAGQTIYVAFVRHTRDDNGLFLDDITIEESQLPEITLVGTTAPIVGLSTTYSAHLDGGQANGLTWSWQSSRATAGTATMTTIAADTITMLYATTGIDTLRLIGSNSFGADTVTLVVNPISIGYATLPYSTGFEANDDTTWTISNGPNGWYLDTAAAATGSYSLYISADNGATNGYNNSSATESFVYKAFNFASVSQYGVSFDWKAQGESCCDYIQAYLVPADDSNMVGTNYSSNIPGTWRLIGSRLNGSNEWQNTSSIIAITAPGVYYVCFRWHNDGSVGADPAGAIDNIEIMQITCPAPTGLVFDSITSSSTTFHWSPFDTDTVWSVQVGSLAPVTVTDTFYTVNGLTHATNYSVKVRAICGVGDTSLALSGSFWTECNAFSVPYYIQLDGYNGIKICWNQIAIGGTSPSTSWLNSSTYGNEYIYSYAPSASNPTSDYLISPEIQIPATDTTSLRLVLNMAGYPYSSYSASVASYQVLVSPTGADSVASFTDILFVDTLNTTTFVTRRLPLGAYAGQTIRIAIRNVSRASGQVAIYDFGVRYTNMPLYHVSGSTTVFTNDINSYVAVHEEGDTSTMTYSWSSTMAAAGQAIITNANTDSMTIIYTAAGTDSITFIATNAFGADTTAFHVSAYNCDVINTFPYTEPFENNNPCWLPVYADGDPTINTIGVTTDMGYNLPGTHGGSSALRFSSYSTSSDYNQYLISPELGGNNLVLSFWAAVYGSSDHLWVGYSTTTNDTAAFTWGNELVLDSYSWTEIIDTLPTGTKYVAFRYYGDYAYYAYLDDLTIDGINVCAMPEITSIDREESSLTVNFTSEADSVELTIVAGQQFNENAASVIATGNSYTFTGLTHSTIYTIGLRSLCNSVDFSEWNVVVDSTLTVNCGIPTALAVESTGYTSVTLSWTAAGEEHGWEVMVCNTIDTIHATSTTTTATVNGLMASTTYNAFVRALCGQNADIEGEWSAPIQLTTNSCAPVTDVTVSNVTGTTADVSWTAPEGATSFRVLYGLHDFTQGEELGTYTVSESQYHLTGLEITTDYTVRIANLCTETLVSQYASANFTTGTEGIATVDAEGNLSIYPNPANSMVTISVSEQLASTTATVIDLNGRTVATFTLTDNTATFDVSSLAKGAYFVRITGEQATTVRKLIVK